MQKTMKRVLILISTMLLSIILFATKVHADDKVYLSLDQILFNLGTDNSVGKYVNIAESELVSRNDLYCIQHGVSFNVAEYRVAKYMHFNGCYDTATFDKSPSALGAMLSYILYAGTNYGNGYGTGIGQYGPGQQALYHTYNQWYRNIVVPNLYLYNQQGPVTEAFAANESVQLGPDGQQLYDQAKEYGDVLYDVTVNGITISDNTNTSNLSVVPHVYNGEGYQRIGPFNWKFSGDIMDLEIYTVDGARIPESNIVFSKYEGTTEIFFGKNDIKTQENFYINLKMDENYTSLGKVRVGVKIPIKIKYEAHVWFLVSPTGQNILLVKPVKGYFPDIYWNEFNYNIDLTKEIEIQKTDSRDENIPLDGVGFILRNKEMNRYVKKTGGRISYVPDRDSATVFFTDSKGKIKVDGVLIANYEAIEVINPHYGYVVEEQKIITIPYQYDGITKITNYQRYVKLSGYIWDDIQSEKMNVRNEYYKNDNFDNKDIPFNNITVRLKDKDGNIVRAGSKHSTELNGNYQEIKSGERGLYGEINGGEYIFEYVTIDQLPNYYVEFEYDGLVYQSVAVIDLLKNNASKATDRVEREVLDRNFTSVDSTGKNQVNVNNGTYNIYYNNTVNHATSIVEKTTKTQNSVNFVRDESDCIVHANTRDANYNLHNSFKPTMEEIKYINLGLYEKPQADIALAQDLANVNIGVNGYWHIYNYGKRFNEQNKNGVFTDNSASWNVGVKFKDRYSETYKRAVYQADYEYQNPNDTSKEMQVYLTYKIGLKNESSYVTRVNNIVDYFDNRYEFVAAGTGVNDRNEITGRFNNDAPEMYNNDYQKIKIYNNSTIQANSTNYIFVQFKLNREAVLNIVNNKETLHNVSEVNSYTVYKDGKTVAAIDKDSVPGNSVIGTVNTYEDDIDAAPSIQLELVDAREIKGTVFLDTTNDNLLTGEIRQGSGIFENGEKTIPGVKVTLHELNNSIPDMTFVTGEDGNFVFTGYIPGQYTVTYTWGDKTYKVQNYKGTIYQPNRNQSNMYWYKDNEFSYEPRYTDAIDNYNERLEIDKQIAKEYTDSTVYDVVEKAYNGENPHGIITSMNSVTPTMEFSVEYETTETVGTKDEIKFTIPNVDFGIVERARQQLDMTKRVSKFKITLANGQILADATIDENGNLQGSHNHVTYMKPSVNNGIKDNGYIKAEIDNELLEGATLELVYKIKAINNSEVEYMSEDYYKYGIITGDPVTLTPSAVVDYLNANLVFEQSKNSYWKQITLEELKELNPVRFELGNPDYINSKTILYTEETAVPLKPTETKTVDLNISKLLTTTDDLTFDNEAETVKIDKPEDSSKPTGSIVKYFPGDEAEEVTIIPSTGENRNYVTPIIIGITAFVILGVGIIIIKKKVIDNK